MRYGRAERRLPLVVRLLPRPVLRALASTITSAIDEANRNARATRPWEALRATTTDVWITPKGDVGVRVQERF